MSLQNLNLSPRLTNYLVDKHFFKSKPFISVDIGARGGADPLWMFYGDQVKIIGFEPDAQECQRLNKQAAPNQQFFPYMLYKQKESKTFYFTNLPAGSSLLPMIPEIVQRFPDYENLSVKKEIQMDTIDFDSVARSQNIPYVDFMKLDTESSEFEILEGASETIAKSVIGINCEAFFSRWRKDQKLFCDIDIYLRDLGFSLYDMSVYRMSRKSLSGAPLGYVSPYGQAVWCQALYLRDAFHEISYGKLINGEWDEQKVFKLVSLFEIHCLPDCAIELLELIRDRGITSFTEDEIKDLRAKIISGFNKNRFLSHFKAIKPYLQKMPYYKEWKDKIRKVISK